MAVSSPGRRLPPAKYHLCGPGPIGVTDEEAAGSRGFGRSLRQARIYPKINLLTRQDVGWDPQLKNE